MSCQIHSNHEHKHGEGCGHPAVKHDDHVDYLHDGHLHHVHEDHIDEHKLDDNGDACTSGHTCGQHDANHQHGDDCGHQAVPHGDHVDYLVDGHLHHSHDGHCDDHGRISLT